MTQLTLTQRTRTAQRLDMRAFTPDRLAGLNVAEIRSLPIRVGNRTEAKIGDLFDVSGEPGERMQIVSAAGNLDGVGAGMSEGELILDGDAGHGTGSQMTGGTLTVRGSTGDDAGCGMTGGRLFIEGDTGDRLGGQTVGATRGMSGGLIRVTGNTGDRVGERLRRGMILIQGDTGSHCGVNMIAGTIVVGGAVGPMAGSGMRRGTLLLSREPAGLPATFNDNGLHDLSFLGLLLRDLNGMMDLSAWSNGTRLSARRYLGDIGDGGIGEILWPAGQRT
jgi:formylmethanofuran dehydrogenase subunit C